MALRRAALKAMGRRACYRGPVGLHLEIFAAHLETGRNLLDYLSGIMDTLDGSHGATFTYLPVAYEDDCQVFENSMKITQSSDPHYKLRVEFLRYQDMYAD